MMKSTIAALMTLLFSTSSLAVPREIDRQHFEQGRNLLRNPGAESGKSGFSVTGSGTLTLETAAGLEGKRSLKWNPFATAEFLNTGAVTIPKGMQGRECLVQSDAYLWDVGTTGDIKLQAFDGTNVLAEIDLEKTSGVSRSIYVVFTCPTSGTLELRFASTADAQEITLDSLHSGANIRGISVQSSIGDWESFTPVGTWTTNVTYTGFRRVIGDTAEYSILVALAGVPGFGGGLNITLPAGDVIDLSKVPGGLANGDQISSSKGRFRNTAAFTGDRGTVIANPVNTTTVALAYIEENGGTNIPIGTRNFTDIVPAAWANGDYIEVQFSLPIVGLSAPSKAISVDTSPMFWSGFHSFDCVFARTNVAFGDPTPDASCTLTTRESKNFGSVVSHETGGSSLPGIRFTPKRASEFYVCAHVEATGSDATGLLQLRLIDNASGKIIADQGAHSVAASKRVPVPLCGIYNADGPTQKNLTVVMNASTGTVTVAGGQSTIEWTIIEVGHGINALQIDNLTVSPRKGGSRFCSVSVENTAGVPSIIRQSGSCVASITDTAVGDQILNFSAGTFSSAPVCVCTSDRGNADQNKCNTIETPTASTQRILLRNGSTGASVDEDYNVICVGDK